MKNTIDARFYRETVQSSAIGEGKVIRQRSKLGVYAHVRVEVHPLTRGQGVYVAWMAAESIPTTFTPAVIDGVYDAMNAGVLAGVPMLDVHASIEDGSYHHEDSTADAFREAARVATSEALRHAQPILMEALAQITASVPTEFVPTILRILCSSMRTDRHPTIWRQNNLGRNACARALCERISHRNPCPHRRSLHPLHGVYRL